MCYLLDAANLLIKFLPSFQFNITALHTYSWRPKGILQGSSIKLSNCKRSRKQRFRGESGGLLRSRNPNLCIAYAQSPPDVGAKVKLQNCTDAATLNWA